jgi:hypothetical protein
MSSPAVSGIALMVIVLIALAVWRVRQDRAREAAISQWAASRGWKSPTRPRRSTATSQISTSPTTSTASTRFLVHSITGIGSSGLFESLFESLQLYLTNMFRP